LLYGIYSEIQTEIEIHNFGIWRRVFWRVVSDVITYRIAFVFSVKQSWSVTHSDRKPLRESDELLFLWVCTTCTKICVYL
jgi:hypothetical protein